MRISPVAALSVRREARFTNSPVTVYSRWRALPVPLATTSPLAMPICTPIGWPSSAASKGTRLLDVEGGPDASLRVVAMGHRGAEDRHNTIADVLVDGPAVIGNACVGKLEEAPEEGVDLLGVEFVGELRVAGEVGEQHRHLPPLSLGQVRRQP